jgi:hypothetical protein
VKYELKLVSNNVRLLAGADLQVNPKTTATSVAGVATVVTWRGDDRGFGLNISGHRIMHSIYNALRAATLKSHRSEQAK